MVLLLFLGLPAKAVDGLGISVSFGGSNQTSNESAGSLWVGAEQGSVASRKIVITSLSTDVVQQIGFAVYDKVSVDGKIVTETTRDSELASWVSFTPSNPQIAPGESVEIEMRVSIPDNAPDRAYDLNLRVFASTTQPDAAASESGTRATVGTMIGLDSDFWLGVGDALELVPDFEINAIDGVLIAGKNYIRVFFDNNGLVTIQPRGRLQLSDPAFVDRVFEPLDFVGPEISDGSSGFVDVSVGPEVVDGFYRTFVTAESGGVRKTRLFEGQLVFDDPNILTVPELALRIFLFVAAGFGMVMGVRLLRRKKPVDAQTRDQEPEIAPARNITPQAKATKSKPATREKGAEGKATIAQPPKTATSKATPQKTNAAESRPRRGKASVEQPQSQAKPASQPKPGKTKPTTGQAAKTTRKSAPSPEGSKDQDSDTESK